MSDSAPTKSVLIQNASWVLMADDEGGVLRDVSILVRDGRIAEIGPDVMNDADVVIDARGTLVMPGLVNLHTHLPMTLLRGVAEDVDLQGFLERVWAEEARLMTPEGAYVGARLGALESLLGGTTTALDMYFHPESVHRGAVEVGLRHVTGPVFFSFPGPDGLSWDQRMKLARDWPGILAGIGGPFVPAALMPHAAFTVGPEHLREIADLAREQGAIVHTHASENEKENADTIAQTGRRPVAVLKDSGILAESAILGHGVHLDDDEVATVAAAGAAIAHCPGSNLKLASGAADVVGYRERGVRVGIGTDGCSSSNDLDMFAAMRQAALLARLVRDDPAAVSARDIVRSATLDGAAALGMADRLGSVEVGKEADLVILDLHRPHLVPVRDPYTSVVFSAGRSDVRDVMVGGEIVVRDRRPRRVDTGEVIARASAVVGEVS